MGTSVSSGSAIITSGAVTATMSGSVTTANKVEAGVGTSVLVSTGGSATDATIYTVTAGKTLYITAVAFYGTAAGLTGLYYGASTNIIQLGVSAANGCAVATGLSIPIAASSVIKVSHSIGASNCRVTLIGYEV